MRYLLDTNIIPQLIRKTPTSCGKSGGHDLAADAVDQREGAIPGQAPRRDRHGVQFLAAHCTRIALYVYC